MLPSTVSGLCRGGFPDPPMVLCVRLPPSVWSLLLVTGPLYEIPEAFFKSGMGSRAWEELLKSGGTVKKKQPWCGKIGRPQTREHERPRLGVARPRLSPKPELE